MSRIRRWRSLIEATLLSALSGSCAPPAPPAALGAVAAAAERVDEARRAARPSGPPPPPPDPEPLVLTVSAVGDCALGDLQHGAGAPGSFASRLGAEADPTGYPFSGVGTLLHDDDLTIANLEGTLTERRGYANPVFSIRGDPGYAAMLARGGVELVDLANNHSHDYGVAGHEDTKRALAEHGVGHFGHGQVDRRRIGEVEVVNLGYLGGSEGTRARMERDVARETRRGTIVIVSFHWGNEGVHAPNDVQLALGRAAIDAGADLVLGHHPHVLQPIETYRGRHIVYSLGNFVFGANSQPTELDAIIYQERFFLERGRVVRVEQRIIPIHVSGDPYQNDFRPVVLEGAARERVLDKLDRLSRYLPARGA